MTSDTLETLETRAWLVDLDGTLYHHPPVKRRMAVSLLLRNPGAVQLLRRFRKEHEGLRDRPPPEGTSPYDEQITRTSTATGATPERVREIVEDWMLERPGRIIRNYRRDSLIEEIAAFRASGGKTALVSDYPASKKLAALAIADLFDRGLPLVERVVTVTGAGVEYPRNLRVPIGTPVRTILEHCGLRPEADRVILGGPMMGAPQKSLDVPVLKGTSGLLCLPGAPEPTEFPCIRCARCVRACPMFLNPARLARLVRAERPDEAAEHHLMSCFECGSCSYVCPSGIPLVQWMRVGKQTLRAEAARAKAKAAAEAADAP